MNYFSTEKGIDRVYSPVDRVHGASSRGLQILIKRWSSTWRSTAKIKMTKGYFQ
jgi:hypothetical protein